MELLSRSEGNELSDQELFNRISDHYARKDIIESTRLAREAIVKRAIRGLLSSSRDTLGTVVDIGCGVGAQVEYLNGKFNQYIGIDYSDSLIRLGRDRYGHRPDVEFWAKNIKDPSLPGRIADTIIIVGALHHMHELSSVETSIRRLAKPNANFVAIEPQCGNPAIQLLRKIRMKLDKTYSSDQRFFSHDELSSLLNGMGLSDLQLEYQGFVTPPLAQAGMHPQALFFPLSRLACTLEPIIERVMFGPLKKLSWNLVAYGRFDAI